MDDLTTWLLEQVAEDERIARTATSGPWITDTTENDGGVLIRQHNDNGPEEHVIYSAWADKGDPDCEHVTRWNPVRVLAECEAKRRTIALFADQQDRDDEAWGYQSEATQMLREYGAMYATLGRPGYREEWRP
jgi:hypothetical protein